MSAEKAEALARKWAERAIDNGACASQYEIPEGGDTREAYVRAIEQEIVRLLTALLEAREALRRNVHRDPPCERAVVPCGECDRCAGHAALSRLDALGVKEE